MADNEKAPLVPRTSLRDFPALRQQAFMKPRLKPLTPPDPDAKPSPDEADLPDNFRENITQEYRRKE